MKLDTKVLARDVRDTQARLNLKLSKAVEIVLGRYPTMPTEAKAELREILKKDLRSVRKPRYKRLSGFAGGKLKSA